MKVLEIPYSESLPDAVRMTVPEFEQELKLALAAKLFELGRLSSGQAADLAGVTRVDLLKVLHRFKVNAIDWSADEFSQEISNA
ncbi:MAG: UPF0175 family protein [Verrucomicrobia bacterium]|nr:UPF0175 family protein [Verrucomicrobiota bacterium]